MGRACSRYGSVEVHTGFWWENLEGDHLEDRGIDGRTILKWIFDKWDGAWTVSVWVKIETGGWLL
jgi:hypothetical protein